MHLKKHLKVFPRSKKNLNSLYLEVYIEEDGSLIFTPLTKGTVLVYQALKGLNAKKQSLFCG